MNPSSMDGLMRLPCSRRIEPPLNDESSHLPEAASTLEGACDSEYVPPGLVALPVRSCAPALSNRRTSDSEISVVPASRTAVKRN